jgi:very-short-patch-repair endonuclease
MRAADQAYKNARRFRRDLSLPEKLLWRRIKGAEPRIRRQAPGGHYVLDFYCAGVKLAIEVDGAAHDFGARSQRDEVRTRWLNSQGIEVLRIPARDVLKDPDSVAEALLRYCTDRAKPLHHSVLLSGPPPRSLGAGRSE